MPSKPQGFPRYSELTVFVGVMLMSGVITFSIANLLVSRSKGPSTAHASDQKDLASTNRTAASSRPWTPADGEAHVCAMHCEPGRLYASGAICPVCRMRTDPVSKLPYTVGVVAESAIGESAVSDGTPVRLNWKIKDPSGLELSPKALEAVHFGPLAIAHTSLAGVLPVAVADTADIPSVVFDAAQLGPIALQPESDSDRAAASTYLLLGSAQLPVYTPPSSAPVSVDASKSMAGSMQPARPFAARFVLPAATASAATTGRLATPAKLIEDFDVVKIADRAEGRYEARIRCNGRFYHANEASLFRVNVQRRANLTNAATAETGSDAAHRPVDLDTFSPDAPDRIELVIVSNDLRTPLRAVRIADPADPLATEAANLGNGKSTDALFAVNFPTPGFYRMFFIVTPSLLGGGGTPFTIPFTINALEAEGSAAPPSESATPTEPHPDADPSHKHHHHAEN